MRSAPRSLPALVNVGSVLALFMFIYAVVGMNLWGSLVEGEELSRHANFHNFPRAMLLLFRCALVCWGECAWVWDSWIARWGHACCALQHMAHLEASPADQPAAPAA